MLKLEPFGWFDVMFENGFNAVFELLKKLLHAFSVIHNNDELNKPLRIRNQLFSCDFYVEQKWVLAL